MQTVDPREEGMDPPKRIERFFAVSEGKISEKWRYGGVLLLVRSGRFSDLAQAYVVDQVQD